MAELRSQLEVLKALGLSSGLPPSSRRTGIAASPAASPSRSSTLTRTAGAAPVAPSPKQITGSPGAPAASGARQTAPLSPSTIGAQQQQQHLQKAVVVETLRRQLAKSEAALRGAQERLALVEARAAVAQETAGSGARSGGVLAWMGVLILSLRGLQRDTGATIGH